MKSAVVSRTNRGIGLETALAFARAGYRVFATMRSPEKAAILTQKINAESWL
ncbi:MAG: hypothetical protein U5K51_16300 [Flavobacteriaceae bacterium]|nr:hypothetical protein [Flavobacteriaceae bacterium]